MPLSRDELSEYLYSKADIGNDINVLKNDCDMAVYLLDNCEITVPNKNRFFIRVNCNWLINGVINQRIKPYSFAVMKAGLSDGEDVLAYTGMCDFNHVSPEWESILELGFVGLKKRIDKYAEKYGGDEKKGRFYCNVSKVYDAILRFLKRASVAALSAGKTEMAQGLKNLSEKPPANMFEAMQITQAYYVIQMCFDGTVLRTLGRLDKLLYPFYNQKEKKYTEELIRDYLIETDSFKYTTNIPFAIGGRDVNGICLVNELSRMLLDGYINTDVAYVKLHLLYSENMPEDLVKTALNAVRNGKNSIVFMSDKRIVESLVNIGVEQIDAVNYHIVGCYECGGDNEVTCSCNARVNLPKALELTLNSGVDVITNKCVGLKNDGQFKTFEDLYAECIRQIKFLCNSAINVTDIYEKNYNKIHSAPIFSGTYTSAVENGGDIYCDYAAKYNNSSVNAIGLATLVDSLMAIKKIVYEDKVFTIGELTDILKADWNGNEQLRLIIKNKFPKFGIGDCQADNLAKNITDVLIETISGRRNKKGGVYRLGLFSLDWRWEFGKKTAASADGRLSGETLSQNTSASFGADREGATAHLISVSRIDSSKTPNGTIADIDIHYSSVMGENGLVAMLSTLKSYFDLGGFAVQYNVLNTEVLKRAKNHPEDYPNLQVRLCGWNVLFANLSDDEKNEFIIRSEK